MFIKSTTPRARHLYEESGAQAEVFRSRLRCYLASLNRSLLANKVRNHCRHRRVETNYVEHAAVVRISEGEAVGGHAHNDCLCVTDELTAILTQRLRRMNVASPSFAVRVGHETRHVQLVASSPQHRQGAVRAAHRDLFDHLDDFGQSHTWRDGHAGDARLTTAMHAAVTTARRSREPDDF